MAGTPPGRTGTATPVTIDEVTGEGKHQYIAWGDNHYRVVEFTHPAGGHDPDGFFARH